VDDTLTITFLLAPGKTSDGTARSTILPAATLWMETQKIRFDPTLEDMGVGNLLDDPTVVALDVAWVDDYEDTSDPILTATAIHYTTGDERPDAVSFSIDDTSPRAVKAPYYERGVQIIEWVVQYMQDNVYNQDSNQETN